VNPYKRRNFLFIVSQVALVVGCGAATVDYRIDSRFPHNTEAFTQGLVFHNGVLYESTGLYGYSTVRITELETGNVLRTTALPQDRFGEGLVYLNGMLYQLTWKSGTGYIYYPETLALADSFQYDGEGWGLTTDGVSLIMSDGTANLRFLDPTTFAVNRTVEVKDGTYPLQLINELEFIGGYIFANVLQTDWIVTIDPETGAVTEKYDLSGLLTRREALDADVLNGIAYDQENDKLYVTGKNWPYLFEIVFTKNDSL